MEPSEWHAFIERSRDKWREVPGDRQERVFSRDLLSWDDEALLAYWERGRVETSIPDVRGWFQDLYRDRLSGLDVADVGPGLGMDGIFFASHGARVLFADIVADNIRLLERLCALKRVRAEFHTVDDVFDVRLPHEVDVLLFVGSLHHAPFAISQREAAAFARWLRPGGLALMLAYPKERYDAMGVRSFEEFGRLCDGERTPWAEWYDDDKVRALFGPDFTLNWSRNFGRDAMEFNWFELARRR